MVFEESQDRDGGWGVLDTIRYHVPAEKSTPLATYLGRYYRTMQQQPRAHQPLSMLKYNPIGTPPLQCARRPPWKHCLVMPACTSYLGSIRRSRRDEKAQDWLQHAQRSFELVPGFS